MRGLKVKTQERVLRMRVESGVKSKGGRYGNKARRLKASEQRGVLMVTGSPSQPDRIAQLLDRATESR